MTISNERGSVVVLVAVMLFLIFFCVALVVDIGHIHNVKIELQRAVDAAALAGAQELPGGTVDATAKAMVNANGVDKKIGNDKVTTEVEIGCWNTGITLGETAFDRFTSYLTPPCTAINAINAVKVTAILEVPHFFFFPVDDTEVTADAIAVAHSVNPVMPLSIISCVPIASTAGNPGTLPGTSPCDIRYYSFSPDTEDTAAWSGLTLNKSAAEIGKMLEGPEGRELFEQIIFGKGLGPDNNGIENTTPSTGECSPEGTTINCGLGMINGEELAPPESFPSPSGFPAPPQPLPKDPVTGIYQPGGFDPMNGYSQNGALPRWYNLTDDGTLKTDDHFVRLWSLDGLLLKGNGTTPETFNDYQLRLKSYLEFPLTAPPAPFNDGRMASLIKSGSTLPPQEIKAIADHYGVANSDVDYWPDAQKIIDLAGYPRVNVTNGTAAALIDTFFSNKEVATKEILNCSENAPLDGNTVRLQVPVIFAGYCESWKALGGNQQHILNYVGMADFLLTRGWKTGQDGDLACADNFVSAGSCGTSLTTPAPLVGGEFRQVSMNTKAFEGLIKIPEIVGATGNSSTKIYLVE